jgi:succinylarginine dihydrolase
VLNDKWLSEPKGDAPKATHKEVKAKARNYASHINQALKSNELDKAKQTMASIRKLRQAGLEQGGEYSVENLAFKLLRARGQIDKLRKYIDKLESAKLSIGEHNES